MPHSYVIIKDTPIADDGENRDVHIIHQESLVRNMFTRDSRKVPDILKELTYGPDFIFEKYDTKIKGIFNVLWKYGVPL